MRIAVVDLGSNVFNLLIAQVSKGLCEIDKIVKVPARIGVGGFQKRELTDDSINSAVEAFSQLHKVIESYPDIEHSHIFATSAIRDSENGKLFANLIEERFGEKIEIISGDREAELIYKGVRESIILYDETVLILDIGGGSNELILADKHKIVWKKSFPLGIIRMKEFLNPSDPITQEEIIRYKNFLDNALEPFYKVVKEYSPQLMIGSSGSFDTLRELLYPHDDQSLPLMELPMEAYGKLHQKLLKSTFQERVKMSPMMPIRAEYMVLGSIFIEHLIEKIGIETLYQSSYSLKEGYMAEVAASIKE